MYSQSRKCTVYSFALTGRECALYPKPSDENSPYRQVLAVLRLVDVHYNIQQKNVLKIEHMKYDNNDNDDSKDNNNYANCYNNANYE